jgi:hypothetical protein
MARSLTENPLLVVSASWLKALLFLLIARDLELPATGPRLLMLKPAHYLTLARRTAQELLAPAGQVARIAFNYRPIFAPWGGANQWLIYFADYLRMCGYQVQWDLSGEVDCIFLLHYGITGRPAFRSKRSKLIWQSIRARFVCIR